MDNKPWDCEQRGQHEKMMPNMKVENFKRASVTLRANTRAVDGCHPKVPLDLPIERCAEIAGVWLASNKRSTCPSDTQPRTSRM